MAPMKLAVAFALLVIAAAPLYAETYKWVDEKGVTNYSNAPPPSRAAKTKLVEDRISVIPSDPTLPQAAAALREREARRDAEWLQRQHAIAAAPANNYPGGAYADCLDCGYYDAYFYPYYGSYFPPRHPAQHPLAKARILHRALPHPTPHTRGGMTRPAPSLRGAALSQR